jgi:hypothetical protein
VISEYEQENETKYPEGRSNSHSEFTFFILRLGHPFELKSGYFLESFACNFL